MWAKVLHSIYNMGTHGLLDMYTLSPLSFGIHIRQTTRAHVTNTKCSYSWHTKGMCVANIINRVHV